MFNPQNNEKIIKVENLKVVYDDRTILENVEFSVLKGEVFVIVGGSGCGKSTLLRQLIGLEKPSRGAVFIKDKNISIASTKEKIEILKTFGILFQNGGLFASMTIAENLALVLETFTELSTDRIMDIIDLKLTSVGLSGSEHLLPSEISGGMKKRAGIARAMILDPEILFLDEPSSGLDPLTAASLDSLILELNKALGTTIIVVSHDLSSIKRIASRIIMLDKSHKGIIAEGTPDDLLISNNESVFNFFNRIC